MVKRKTRRRFALRRRFRRRGDKRLPILPVLGGLVYPMVDSWSKCGGMAGLQANPTNFAKGMLDQISLHYTGVSIFPEMSGVTGWNANLGLINTYTGLVAGIIGSKVASATGINRHMKRIPIIGRRIKL